MTPSVKTANTYNHPDEKKETLNLLSVYSQIYIEAPNLIWTLNIFRYNDASCLEVWKQKRPDVLDLITHVKILTIGKYDHDE
jgi:hypothetical protein